MKGLIPILVLFLSGFQNFAQTGNISGTVVDESGETLPGVSVQLIDENSGKITDLDGKFNYALNEGTYTLVFKFVSYKEKTVSGIVVNSNEINEISLSLEPQDESALNDLNHVIAINNTSDYKKMKETIATKKTTFQTTTSNNKNNYSSGSAIISRTMALFTPANFAEKR